MELDQDKIKLYLAALDDQRREIVKTILDKTICIPLEKVVEYISEEISDFLREDIKFYVYKTLFSERFSEKFGENFLGFIDNFSEFEGEEVDIVIIDDSAHSGKSLINLIDQFTDQKKNKFVFHLIIPYSIPKAKFNIQENVSCKVKFYGFTALPGFRLKKETKELLSEKDDLVPHVFFSHQVYYFEQIYLRGLLSKGREFGSLMKKS